MNALEMAAVCLLIVSAAVSSFVGESLRKFSRSRLDDACRRLGRPDRFATILRSSGDALVAVEPLTVISVVLLAALTGIRFAAELAQEQNAPARIGLLVEPFVVAVGFVLAFFLLPRILAKVAGERFLAWAWPAITLLMRILQPYLALARRLDEFLHRLWGLKEPERGKIESLAAEIKSVVELGRHEGTLGLQSGRIIERVIALEEEDVAAIMTPRNEMDCISCESTLDDARRAMLTGGHSRMPVIGSSTDDVIGILYAKDLLRHLSPETDGHPPALKEIVREPFYVPETAGVDKVLESMKCRRVHIAIVADEYGGVAGLVTMEDVLEQIVGAIIDEYDAAEDTGIRQVGPASLEVASWVRVDDLDEQYGFELPEDEDYDTIGGFVYSQLGRVPKKRDTLAWKQLRLTVLEADKRRIHKIRVDTAALPVRQADRMSE